MTDVVLFAAVSCLGILVQAFAGFGGALLTMPMLVLFLPAQQAVVAYALVIVVMDLFLMIHARRHVQWRPVLLLLSGAAWGVPFGALGLARLPSDYIAAGISGVTLCFALLFLLRVEIRLTDRLPTYLGAGLLSGLLAGSTSQSGPPVVILGLARGWSKEAFRGTLLAYFFFSCSMAIAWFAAHGRVNAKCLTMGAAALVPTGLAAWVGTVIKGRTSEGRFRQVILALIVLVSVVGIGQKVLSRLL